MISPSASWILEIVFGSEDSKIPGQELDEGKGRVDSLSMKWPGQRSLLVGGWSRGGRWGRQVYQISRSRVEWVIKRKSTR